MKPTSEKLINEKARSKQRRAPSLDALPLLELNPHHRRMLAEARLGCGGDPAWKARKEVESTELLKLSQLAPPGRFSVMALDLNGHLRAMVHMGLPIPRRPDKHNQLQLAHEAVLGFTYPREAICQALPGHAFFQILSPRDVWLPQVLQPAQAFCIAASVPAGTRAAWLILMAYGALTMQSVQIDEASPAGVFDAAIARWWQHNLQRYAPLTKTPFLSADS